MAKCLGYQDVHCLVCSHGLRGIDGDWWPRKEYRPGGKRCADKLIFDAKYDSGHSPFRECYYRLSDLSLLPSVDNTSD